MERLTMFLMDKNMCNASSEVCSQQKSSPYDAGCCCYCEIYQKMIDKLADYENAEESGLILRPKCRLGSDVYALWSVPTKDKYVVYQAEVKEINLSSTNARKMLMYKLEPIAFRGRYNKYYDDDFGKLVFMSQEEAEQALSEMKGGQNG